MGGPKNKGYKRSWKNLLLNKRYQLRFTLFMVIMSGVLMAALGWWVMSAAAESTSIGVDAIRDKRECVPPPKPYQDMQPTKSGIDLNTNELDHRKKQTEPGGKIDEVKVDMKIMPPKRKIPGADDKKADKKAGDKKPDDKKADDKKAGDKKAGDKKAGDKKADDTKSGDKTADDKKADDTKSGDKTADGDKANSPDGDKADDDDESGFDNGDIADDEAYRKWKASRKSQDVKVVLDVKVHPDFAKKAIAFYACRLERAQAIAGVRGGQTTILLALIAVGLFLMLGLTLYGLKMTHRVAGPLFKVQLYFAKMRDEKYDKVWNLRKHDQLVEFYEHFKGAHEGVVKMQQADIDQLKEIIEVADKHELASKSPELAATLEELKQILARKEASLDQ